MEETQKLDPCPLCGGRAELESFSRGDGYCSATIACEVCGLTLEYSQEFVSTTQLSGKTIYVPITIDPFEAWNRRTPCKKCNKMIAKVRIFADLFKTNYAHWEIMKRHGGPPRTGPSMLAMFFDRMADEFEEL